MQRIDPELFINVNEICFVSIVDRERSETSKNDADTYSDCILFYRGGAVHLLTFNSCNFFLEVFE